MGDLGLRAFSYPLRGLRFLLRHPRLLSYVAIPFAVNTLLYAFTFWFVARRFRHWIDRLVPTGDGWYWAVLVYFFWALFGVALSLVIVYSFTLVGRLILAPFNEALSASVEHEYTGRRTEEPFRARVFFRDLARSIRSELGRIGLYAAGFVLLLALNLVPLAGTIAYGVGMPLFTLFFLGWEYVDYPMERARFPFRLKRRAAFRNATVFLSFGASSALLLFVPVLNFVAIPVCVAGGTLLFCDLESRGRLPARPLPANLPSQTTSPGSGR